MQRRQFTAGLAALGGLSAITDAQAATKSPKFYTLTGDATLQLRRLHKRGGKPVLYIHGATFSSALSVAYQFGDGRSWEASLHDAGFDVWALDFEGFGGSSRPTAFANSAATSPPQLRSAQAVTQIERAVSFIARKTRQSKINLLAHSWGGVPAASFAARFADKVDQLVLFAPALHRPRPNQAPTPSAPPAQLPAWRYLTVAEQLARFGNDTPAVSPSVLAEPSLAKWGPAWLETDPSSGTRTPASVQIPTGPQADIMALWTGNDLYDPSVIRAKTLLVRGEWDSVCNAADVSRLVGRMKAGLATVHTIPTSGHLAHLETNRALLWSATNNFLLGRAPI